MILAYKNNVAKTASSKLFQTTISLNQNFDDYVIPTQTLYTGNGILLINGFKNGIIGVNKQ